MVTFLPKMDRAPGAGRRELDHVPIVTGGEVGVEPPTEVAVEALGAIDVRDRDDDDLELHVDRPRSRGLSCGFAAHLSTAHVRLLRFGCLEPSLPAVRRRLLASFSLALARCPCRGADLGPALPSGAPR